MFIPISTQRVQSAKGITVRVFAQPTESWTVLLGEYKAPQVNTLSDLIEMETTLDRDAIRAIKRTPDYKMIMGRISRELSDMEVAA